MSLYSVYMNIKVNQLIQVMDVVLTECITDCIMTSTPHQNKND